MSIGDGFKLALGVMLALFFVFVAIGAVTYFS